MSNQKGKTYVNNLKELLRKSKKRASKRAAKRQAPTVSPKGKVPKHQ